MKDDRQTELSLEYHRSPKPGKLKVEPAKSCETQQDLSLAYSPGVAAPCLAIKEDVRQVYTYTSKANMVAVVSDGTAVEGLETSARKRLFP